MAMEVFFREPAEPAVVEHIENIPYSIKGLDIYGGTLVHRPKDPVEGTAIRVRQVWKSDVLIRVAIMGDPSGGDGGLGPGSVLILNHVLKTTDQPCTVIVPPFTVPCESGAIPVPPDGSPYQLKVQITATAVGGGWPVNTEIELCGRWW
jgi:hypothetical protein